jgi:nickel-dependent lactate racemase
MPDISVPWGREELVISLPHHWKIQQIAKPELRPAPEDWPERLAFALNQPAAGAPLAKLLASRRRGRIELIVEDITRRSPLAEMLAVLMREIRHAGIRDEQIEILFATGMHQPMTERQVEEKLGQAVSGIKWRCNPWQDKSAYVGLGRLERIQVWIDRRAADADLRIILSSVSPHLQAGFGGGYKMLFPGCAHLDTVGALHRLGVRRTPRQLVGTEPENNPMRRAIDAAGRLVDQAHGKTFAVQYLLDEAHLPTFIAAGEPTATHRMVAKQCSVACGIVTESPADVLIVDAHPVDYDLWQSFKCIPNTRWAVRPGGVIICVSRCEVGLGGMNVPRWPLSPAWTRRILSWLGPKALSSLITRLIPRLAGDAAFFVRMALQTLHRNPVFMVSPTLYETAGKFPGVELVEKAPEAVFAVDRMMNGAPQRVIVFPSGGISFPIQRAGAAVPAGRRTAT